MLSEESEDSGEDVSCPVQGIRMLSEESEDSGEDVSCPVPDNKTSVGGPELSSHETVPNSVPHISSAAEDLPLQSEEFSSTQRLITSPTTVTSLSTDDSTMKKALEQTKEAIRMSAQDNIQAKYDLALVQFSLGHLNQARRTLRDIICYPKAMTFQTEIKAHKLMGQVYLQLAETENNEEEKKHLHQNGVSMLWTALHKASRISPESQMTKAVPGELFELFTILLEMTETSGTSQQRKLEDKVQLYKLIGKHQHSLCFLNELEQLDPGKSREEKHLKDRMENHVGLEQYKDAVSVIRLLKCTAQHTRTMQMFEDKQYVLKIYLKAAYQALLRGSATLARDYFRSAFQEFLSSNVEEKNRPGMKGTPSPGNIDNTWDIVVVHEHSAAEKATMLIDVLEKTCGLTVAVMDRDPPPNRLDLEGDVDVIRNSGLVVFMVGGKVSKKTRYFVEYTAKRSTTVTLLVEGEVICLSLKKSTVWNSSLFASLRSGHVSPAEAEDVCRLVASFFNVDMRVAKG